MAREISPVCHFIFGSIWTGLPTDTVDVELTVSMVKGIYTYRKDHMAESKVFLCYPISFIKKEDTGIQRQ